MLHPEKICFSGTPHIAEAIVGVAELRNNSEADSNWRAQTTQRMNSLRFKLNSDTQRNEPIHVLTLLRRSSLPPSDITRC